MRFILRSPIFFFFPLSLYVIPIFAPNYTVWLIIMRRREIAFTNDYANLSFFSAYKWKLKCVFCCLSDDILLLLFQLIDNFFLVCCIHTYICISIMYNTIFLLLYFILLRFKRKRRLCSLCFLVLNTWWPSNNSGSSFCIHTFWCAQ